MCGLCGGVSSELYEYEQEALRTLLVLNMFRGTHSTGMFDLLSGFDSPEKVDVGIYKTTKHPLIFAGEEFTGNIKDRWKKTKPSIIAIHTRLATRGSIKKANAHPFNFYPVVGMHNGTLTGKFRNSRKYETDSEALYYNIAKLGLEETLDVIKDTNPAYAMVWLDYQTMRLNFFRNSNRPLHYTKQCNTVYWSSEKEDLLYAGKKHKRNILDHEVKAFIPGKLYSIDMNSKTITIDESDVKLPKITHTVISTPPFTFAKDNKNYQSAVGPMKWEEMGSYHRTAMFSEYDQLIGKWYTKQQINTLEAQRERAINRFRNAQGELIAESYRAREGVGLSHEINGRPASKAAWELKVKEGCACCGNEADSDAPGVIYWINDQNFICPDCQDNALDPKFFLHKQATISMEDLEDFCTQRWQHITDGYSDASFKRTKKESNDNKPTLTAEGYTGGYKH